MPAACKIEAHEKYCQFLDDTKCRICEKSYKSERSAREHLRNKHANILEQTETENDQTDQLNESINLDEPAFEVEDELQNNTDEQANDEEDIMDQDNHENTDQDLEKSMEVPKYVCYPCNKGFEMEYELKIHQKKCNTKSCTFCQETIKADEPQGHDLCSEASKYIRDRSCSFCDFQYSTVREVYQHVIEDHLSNVSTNNSEVSDIQITKVESAFPVAKRDEFMLEQTSAPSFMDFGQEEEDPRIVNRLFKCPICLKCLLFFPHAEDHIARFHRIPQQHQVRMGLKIEEILISDHFFTQ